MHNENTMSRHVATIARQQLPITCSIDLPAARAFPLQCGINTSRSLSSHAFSSSRAIWNSTSRPQNVSIVNKSTSCLTQVSHALRASNRSSVNLENPSSSSLRPRSIITLAQKRWKSDKATPAEEKSAHDGQKVEPAPKTQNALKTASAAAAGGKHHLLDHLPHLHRPTKEELLAAATGFWQRPGRSLQMVLHSIGKTVQSR